MIPPKTPICKVFIPQTEAIVPSSTSFDMLPSERIFPFISSILLMDMFITKYAITADKAETSFSFFAIPIATPTANNNGRLSKTALPTLFIITSNACKIVPSPRIFPRLYISIVVSFVNELPSPSKSPATGKIAIGSMKLLPILCKTSKILSFIIISISAHIFCIM